MSGIRIYYRPSATSGEPAEAAEDNIHTREDDSRPHSPASDKESSEAQKRDTATSRSNDQSSNVEKEPEATSKHEKVIENESPNNQNVYRPYGYRRRIRVPRGDPWDVEWRSSITKYEHRPSNFRQREISPDKRKLDMLMYRADQLRHQRYVTPIQRIETLAPSYPDRLPPLIPPAFTGHEPPSVQHPMAVTEPERRCLPPHMSPVFTGQSPAPSEGLWTDVGNGRKMHWRIRQMKAFLDVWDQHWDCVSRNTDHCDTSPAVLETQDWYWEEPYVEWDPEVDGHTNDPTTVSGKESGDKGKNKNDEAKDDLWAELNSI